MIIIRLSVISCDTTHSDNEFDSSFKNVYKYKLLTVL